MHALKLVGVLSLLVLGSACSDTDRGKITVQFWAMGQEGEVVQRLVPAFEERHPNIHIRVQQVPWSAAHAKLLTAYAGDCLPDIFQLGNTWIPEFVTLRALAPLTRRVAASAKVDPGDFFHGIMQTNILHGQIFALPWYVDTRVLFYRTDILHKAGYAKPPKTWAGWLSAMRQIQLQAGPHHHAVLLPLDSWAPLVVLAMQQGAQLLRDNNSYGNFQSKAFRRAFKFYIELFRNRLAPPVSGADVSNIYQDFARGTFAYYISGPWNVSEFRSRLPLSMQDDWATAPLPSPVAGTYPGVSLAGGASLALSRRSVHKAAAWKFMQFLSQASNQVAFYRLSGDLPTVKAAWKNKLLRDNPRVQSFREQLRRVASPPKIPEWQRIATQMARYVEQVVRGRMTENQALANLDRDVDKILEKRRWLLSRGELPSGPAT